MRKLEVKIRQIVWAIKKSFKPSTNDLVIYCGKDYFIKPSMTGEDTWNLFKFGENVVTHGLIDGNDLVVVHSFSRFVRRFRENLSFQEQNWGSIDGRNPMGTRLTYENSEDIKFNNQK